MEKCRRPCAPSRPRRAPRTAGLALTALACALAWPAAPASALSPVTVTRDGEHPNVLVDQVGTAHVVWNETQSGSAPDVLHYCRIPRATSTCVGEKSLVPPESPPDGNRDYAVPRVVQTSSDEIVLITHRYPTVVVSHEPEGTPDPACFENNPQKLDACYGSSNNSTWAFVTHDGGDSFLPAKLVGTGRTSGPAIGLSQGPFAPAIATVSDTETGGTFAQVVPPSGYSHDLANLGDEGRDRAYSGSVAAFDGTVPMVAFADLSGQMYVRAYRGGPPNDSAGWGPSVSAGPGAEPRLAGGPAGTYLLYKATVNGGFQYVAKRVLDATGRLGAEALPVSEVGGISDRDIAVDGEGRLHVAWVERPGGDSTLRYRVGLPATGLETSRKLATGDGSDFTGVDIATADDGGGFAIYAANGSGHSVITAIPFGSQKPLIDVRVTGVEVTQSVQAFKLPARDPSRPNAPVPYTGALLSACCGRGGSVARTVVRVYANSRTALPAGTAPPTVRLRAFRNGRELGTGLGNGLGAVLPEFSPKSLTAGGPSDVPLTARQDPSGAYTFTLPYRWTDGKVTLSAEVNPQGLTPAIGECVRCREDNTFTLTDLPFRVTTTMPILPLAMKANGVQPKDFPDPAPRFAGLLATTPLHVDVQPYQAFLDVTDIVNDPGLDEGDRSEEAREMVVDWSDDNNDELSSLYPVGIYPKAANIRGQTNSDGELYGDEQPTSIMSDDRPLTTGAHEAGHAIGLIHAGRDCDQTREGDDQEGEVWPPENKGLLDGIGLDLSKPSPYRVVASGAPSNPATVFDLMSYCSSADDTQAWITVRNWDRLVQFRAPPQLAARAARVGRAGRAASAGATLKAVAFVSKGKARISRVTPDDGAATPPVNGSPFALVARDKAGAVLARAGVSINRAEDVPGVVRVAGNIAAPGAASLAFEPVSGGAPLAGRARSANAPKVAVLAPAGTAPLGAKASVKVRWRATDADKDALDAWVDYSADDGRHWRTVAVGASRGSVTLPRRLFTASRNARVRVRINDGFNETVAASGRLRSLGAPPEVTIRAPTAGSTYAGGSAVPLDGSAWDDAGRPLTGRRLRWLDGRRLIGTGAPITAIGLAPGRRKLTLEAKDKGGRVGRRVVSVRIRAVAPLFTRLTAPAKISRRARSVTLQVAATVPSSLSAGGRRFAVGLKPTRVVVPVKPGRSVLTLALKLASGGKVTRVTQAVGRK